MAEVPFGSNCQHQLTAAWQPEKRPVNGLNVEQGYFVMDRCMQQPPVNAERTLKFACPTQDANGKWYRATLAVSNVPVHVLYNVLSNMNFIAQHLREIAARTTPPGGADEIRRQAGFIDALHGLLKQTDSDTADQNRRAQ